MNAAKKATFEMYAVAGLLLVFGLTLWSSLRRTGLLGAPRAAHAPIAPKPVSTPPVAVSTPAIPLTGVPPAGGSTSPAPRSASDGSGQTLYTAQTLRDPLVSLLPKPLEPAPAPLPLEMPGSNRPDVTPPQLTVQGLWWGDEKPKAIISGQIYGIGDEVDGAVITGIGRDGVTLEFQGESMRLTTAAPSPLPSGDPTTPGALAGPRPTGFSPGLAREGR